MTVGVRVCGRVVCVRRRALTIDRQRRGGTRGEKTVIATLPCAPGRGVSARRGRRRSGNVARAAATPVVPRFCFTPVRHARDAAAFRAISNFSQAAARNAGKHRARASAAGSSVPTPVVRVIGHTVSLRTVQPTPSVTVVSRRRRLCP